MTNSLGKTRLLALAIGATSAFAAAGGDTTAPFEDTQFDRMLPSVTAPTAVQERDSAAGGAGTSAPVVSAPFEDTQFDRMLPNLTAARERDSAAKGIAGPAAPIEAAETWLDRRIPDPYLP